jgi:hypothetical protein
LLGEGGKMRHLRLVSVDDIRPTALLRLVQVAADLKPSFW